MGNDGGSAGAMIGHDMLITTAENYRRFAVEVAGRSPAYGALADAVAADDDVLAFLHALPTAKRQPNLLFAAARYVLGVSADIDTLRRLVRDRAAELVSVMRTRRTQTNEPARCATLLPALSMLDGPLALLEVGASAGLTLLPDVYSYDYAGHVIQGVDPDAPTLACQPHGRVPLPDRVPTVAWRTGIDLNPLAPTAADDAEWLRCLVWPGEGDRAARLDAALATARRHRVPVHRGDLVEDLARVAAMAPAAATLVVYHSAVLAYVDDDTRHAFAEAVRHLGAVWLSNEAPGVLSGLQQQTGVPEHAFVLVRDGSDVLAYTDSHGTWIDWQAAG